MRVSNRPTIPLDKRRKEERKKKKRLTTRTNESELTVIKDRKR